MEKLNSNRNELWQKPKPHVDGPESEWFVNQVLGKDTLNNAMKCLSAAAGLSKTYTNHSIRATVVTVMDDNDCPTRHIQATTGHKSESSIKAYAKKISAKKRREICELLQNQVHSENPPPPPAVAVPTNNLEVVNAIDNPQGNQQNFQDAAIPQPQPANFIPAPHDFWPENAQFELANQDDDASLVQALANIEQENHNMGINPPQAVPVQMDVPAPNAVAVQELVPQMPHTEGQQNPNPLQQLNVSNINNVSNIQPAQQMPNMYFPGSTVTINYHFHK